MKSHIFSINAKDILKGLVMAALVGAVLPISLIIQEPNFSISTVNWSVLWDVAASGAVSGFLSYIIKNFLSDEEGKVLGRIG